MLKVLAQFLLFITAASSSQNYDGLRVTWGVNPFSSWNFAALPRDLNNDNLGSFTLKDNQCSHTGPFKGKRYWANNDPALILLYDVNGYIAGMQTAISQDKYTPSAQNRNHPYILHDGHWILTAYFVDPTIICTSGRSKSEYDAQGTGVGLWLQNGTDVTIQIPLEESEVKRTKWVFGKCFYTMGNHYWYDVSLNMDCDSAFPFFLMYNSGKLNAFGFAINAYLNSRRYEHPTPSAAGRFINPVPKCFKTDPSFAKLSTMHVYFTDWPRTTCHC